jgi:hypothetical protein
MKITQTFPSSFPTQEFAEKNEDFNIIQLREIIKKKYQLYHTQDLDRFPLIEFNTNRKNYEPLRDSFNEEFFIKRKIDNVENYLHIPSTKTFTLIFTDDFYTPNKKIINTCLSYASDIQHSNIQQEKVTLEKKLTKYFIEKKVLIRSFLLLGFIVVCFYFNNLYTRYSMKLGILSPKPASMVTRILEIEGVASDTELVWIVVKPKNGSSYFVQAPIKVQKNGYWKGEIIIGSLSDEEVGQKFTLKAFIKPRTKFKTGDILNSWPQSELSTDEIEVIRSSKLLED